MLHCAQHDLSAYAFVFTIILMPTMLICPDCRRRFAVVLCPALVCIEILSASSASYDRGVKFRAYERVGVRELWLIDPYGPTGTEFYQLQGKTFKPVMPDAEGMIRSVALPSFKLRVTWLWPAEKFISVREALTGV